MATDPDVDACPPPWRWRCRLNLDATAAAVAMVDVDGWRTKTFWIQEDRKTFWIQKIGKPFGSKIKIKAKIFTKTFWKPFGSKKRGKRLSISTCFFFPPNQLAIPTPIRRRYEKDPKIQSYLAENQCRHLLRQTSSNKPPSCSCFAFHFHHTPPPPP